MDQPEVLKKLSNRKDWSDEEFDIGHPNPTHLSIKSVSIKNTTKRIPS